MSTLTNGEEQNLGVASRSTLTNVCEDNEGWVYPFPPESGIITLPPVYSQADVTQLVEGQAYMDVVFGSIQTNDEWVLVECVVVNELDVDPLNIWPGIITDRTAAGFRLQLNGMPDSSNYYLHWAVSGVNIAPSPASTYYLTGPTTGGAGTALTYTVRLPPSTSVSGPVTITLSDGGAGGAFNVASVVLTTSSASATFTYTPVSYVAITISTTNSGTLIDPASVILTVVAPTYTLTGPSTGSVGVASTNFTVTLSGAVFGTVTVTPSSGGGGGTFTPTTVALTTGAPSATFTYTPATIGTVTISVTNSGGLSNPSALSYTVPITGLKLWLKADSLSLSDGAAVATWPDSSGLGNDAAQATSGKQPIYKTSIVNGKPVVRFDGVDDVMGASMLGTVTTAASVFIVQRNRNITLSALALLSVPTNPSNSFACYLPYSDANIYFDLGDTTGTGRVSAAWGGNTTDFFLWSLVAGGGNMAVYRNGTAIISTGGHTNVFNPTGLTLGINGLGAPAPVQDADIAEILICNAALGTTDRRDVETYLAGKYGLTPPPPFDPSAIPGLKLWLKADSLALSDGAAVATWTDSSGSGNTVSQATAGNKPIYKTAIVNGKPVVRFDGVNDYLAAASETIYSGNFSAFVVYQTTGDNCLIGASLSSAQMLRIGISGGNVLSCDNGTPQSSTTLAAARSAWNLGCITRSGTTISFFEAGTARGTGTASGNFQIGTIGGLASLPTALPTNGDIAEVVMYDSALSSTDRVLVENFLKTKYAIA